MFHFLSVLLMGFSLSKLWRRSMLTILVGCLMISQSARAGVLDFVDIQVQTLIDRYTSVHFNTPGNDFQWGVFWLPTISLATPVTITNGFDSRTCTKKLRWIYYNSQRGDRLRPMDQETLDSFLSVQSASYSGLTISGWWYTTCSGNVYAIYGQITLNDRGNLTTLTAGVPFNFMNNAIWSSNLISSLQYFDNKTPLGFVYDVVGGISFVWWSMNTGYDQVIANLNGGATVNQLFSYSWSGIVYTGGIAVNGSSFNQARNILLTLWIKGTIGLWDTLNSDDRRSILGNASRRTSVFNAPNVTIGSLINQVNKNASSLCRGKRLYEPSEWNEALLNNTIVCIVADAYDPWVKVSLDLQEVSDYDGKTFILKNVDLVLLDSMDESSNVPLNVFIDGGNLMLQSIPNNKQRFQGNGYPTAAQGVTSWTLLRGNILVNGLVTGKDPLSSAYAPYLHKLYIHGKLASLNTPLQPTQGRIDQVTKLFLGAGPAILGLINLQEVFARECNTLEWRWGDGSSCSHPNDQFALTPFVIIDAKIPTLLLQ